MKNKVLLILVILLCSNLFTSIVKAQVDTQFWFVAPETTTAHAKSPGVLRISALDQSVTVKISMPANPSFGSVSYTIGANQQINHFFYEGTLGSWVNGQQITQTNMLSNIENGRWDSPSDWTSWNINSSFNKGLLIESTNDMPFSVYYEVANDLNPERFNLKGKNALGKTFIVPSQNFLGNVDASQDSWLGNNWPSKQAREKVDIVATSNNTVVTFNFPSVAFARKIYGFESTNSTTHQITLQKGQTYCLRSNSFAMADNLGGINISSSESIAVTISDDSVGELVAYNGGTIDPLGTEFHYPSYDLIGDQLVPVEVLGTEFIVINPTYNIGGLGRTFNEVFIWATENSTAVTIDGAAAGTINKGEYIRRTVNTNSAYTIKSTDSKPLYVYQITGIGYEAGSAVLPTIKCTGSNDVSFTRISSEKFIIQILIKDQYKGSLVMPDGSASSALPWIAVPNSPGWVTAVKNFETWQIPVNQSKKIKLNDTYYNTPDAYFQLSLLDSKASGVGTGSVNFGYFSAYNSIKISGKKMGDYCAIPNGGVQLSVKQPSGINWYRDGSLFSTSPTIIATLPGLYRVEQTGCSVSDEMRVQDTPNYDLTYKSSICGNEQIVVEATSLVGATYSWSGTGVPAGQTSNKITFSPVEDVNQYIITANVSQGGCLISKSATVNVNWAKFDWKISGSAFQSPIVYSGAPVSFSISQTSSSSSVTLSYQKKGLNGVYAPFVGAIKDVGEYRITATSTDPCAIGSEVKDLQITPYVGPVGSINVTFKNITKVFDGTTAATIPVVDYSVNGLFPGANVTVSSYSSATYSSKDVAINKTVSVSGLVFGGADVNNYIIPTTSTNATSSITPMDITIIPDSIVSSAGSSESFSKTYGMPDPTFTYRFSPALKSGDTFSGALDRANPTVQTVGKYNITLGTLTAGSNYSLALVSSPVDLSIVQKAITVSNIKIADRPYTAGDVTATVSYWGDIVGAVFGDMLSINSTAVTNAYYASDALGGNKLVSFTPALLTLQGVNKDNYRLIQPVVKGNVGVASTAITISNNDVIYNGTPKFVTVSTNPSDPTHTTVVYKISGTNTVVTSPTLAGSYDVFVDVAGGSYVASAQGSLLIRKKAIAAIVPNVAKEYDGTIFVSPIPALSFNAGDIVPSDVSNLIVYGIDATFADKNVGNPKTLTVSGINISGSASSNYQITPVSTNVNSSIFTRTIDPNVYISVADTTKLYDGNTVINTPQLTIHGLLGGDIIKAIRTAKTALYDTKDAGSSKTVTVNDSCWTFSNPTLAANYTWAKSYKNTNSSISTRPVDPTIYIEVADTTKQYDGNAVINTPQLTIHGLLGGDVIKAVRTAKTAIYDTKDVGTSKKVTVNDTCWIFSNPTLAANYTWAKSYTNTNSSITTRPADAKIYIEVADTTKQYDGNTVINTPQLTIHGLLGGDDIKAVRTSKTAVFDTKDAGTSKTVTVNDTCWVFSNPTLAANYSWAKSYKNTNSSITTRAIDPSIYIEVGDSTKIYDGNNIINTPKLTIHGLLGDDIKVIRTGKRATFDTKNAGFGKTITVNDSCWTFSNLTLAANYTWAKSYQNNNSSISTFSVAVTPDKKQTRKYNEVEKTPTYTTQPSTLPNNERLNGSLLRQSGSDVGFYKIEQGSITNLNNPNYSIDFVEDVTYEIFSAIYVELKWGYSLAVDNTGDRYVGYQWYKNGEAVDGQDLQHYSIEKNLCGTYKVKVTFANGDKVFSQDTTFNNCNTTKHLVIAPTLVKSGENLSVSFVDESNTKSMVEREYCILVYEISGSLISKTSLPELSDFNFAAPSMPGTYIIKVLEENSLLSTQKIVVY